MTGQRSALGAGIEFDLIRRFLRDAHAEGGAAEGGDAHGSHVLVGPGDDCAVIRNGTFAISVDLAIEDVHFRRAWLAPEEIGYRAAAAALSDLAAMAAVPVGMLVALALPDADRDRVAPEILRGARAAARSVGAQVIGGDVTRARDALTIDVVVIGSVERPVLRSGALPDDELWVTGRLGAAASAVAAWRAGATPTPEARSAFARPLPRTAEAAWLHAHDVLHALIDVSDGVAGDAGHLAAASGVAIEIEAARVPVHPAARAHATDDDRAALMRALTGGDDYELLFTAAAGAVEPLRTPFEARFDTTLTCIGRVHDGQGVRLRHADGSAEALEHAGYDHFAEDNA